MPNIAKVLKEEIARIAKHVTKNAIAKPLRTGIDNKKNLVNLKKRLTQLEHAIKVIHSIMKSCSATHDPAAKSSESKEWLSGRGIKRLRKTMKLSQANFAKLLGMNPIAVIRWEKQPGKLTFKRKDTLGKILALRGVGVREAQERLAGMGKKTKKTK